MTTTATESPTTEQEPQDTAQEPQETPDAPQDAQDAPQEPQEPSQDAQDAQDAQEEPETFPRSYVERLRDESAKYRQRAQRADDLAAALWAARVAATGRLADPTDLAMPEDADPLDADAVDAAVDDLLTRKPHLASRRPRGDVGQGQGGASTSVDLAGLLRSRA